MFLRLRLVFDRAVSLGKHRLQEHLYMYSFKNTGSLVSYIVYMYCTRLFTFPDTTRTTQSAYNRLLYKL